MKILIINLDKSIFRPGSKSLSDLKDYSRFFKKLFIIAWTRAKEEPILFENRLFIYPTNSRSKLFYIFDTYRIFKKHVKKEKIDLISSQDPFETGLTAFLIGKKYGIPLHLQAHTDFLSPYFRRESILNRIRVLIAKFLIPRANFIRVVSERIKRSLNSKFKILNSKIFVLPIFVDVKKIRESPVKTDLHKKYSQFEFIILMASRLTREKNISLAIETMREIVKNYPKSGLIIVGFGPEENNLKFKIKNLKLYDKIVLEPWTDDIISYYKTADLFLLTSNYEGYGMTMIEAMASGCPVVMTDVGLAGEVLIDKKDGLVVPVVNKNKLVGAISNLIENSELREHLKKNAKMTLDYWPTKVQYLKSFCDIWQQCGQR
jgi:glycosyltransferase involved in cell wall biosynthesis